MKKLIFSLLATALFFYSTAQISFVTDVGKTYQVSTKPSIDSLKTTMQVLTTNLNAAAAKAQLAIDSLNSMRTQLAGKEPTLPYTVFDYNFARKGDTLFFQGFKRITQAQRLAMTGLKPGRAFFQTDGTEGLYISISTGWQRLTGQ